LQKAYNEQAKHIPEEDRIGEFDHFYDHVVGVLKRFGTFSDGGLEQADFSSSRYVDLSPVIVVVNHIAVSEELLAALMTELKKLPGVHGVAFDGAECVAVLSDGRVFTSHGYEHGNGE
jgi:hypothetical protein